MAKTTTRFLYIFKRKTGWYWNLRTAKTYNGGDKVACGGEGYKNKAFCEKMAFSVVRGKFNRISESSVSIMYEVTEWN
jgi:hypothetical protein